MPRPHRRTRWRCGRASPYTDGPSRRVPTRCAASPGGSLRRLKGFPVPTFSPKPTDITRSWHVVDAEDLVLGRMATEVARLLRGKHKPIFAPHLDTGDHVIVVNAAKVFMPAGKAEKEKIYSHSGYPGGLRTQTY